MKTWQKLIFILALIVFVGVSVTISLISISRPPYAFDEKTEIGGDETLNGWVLTGFNGNIGTKTLTIDFVRNKDGKEPDETRPVVAVKAYAVNADEYVEELVIGKSVQRIEETSFYNLKKLQRVTVDPENPTYTDRDGVLYSKDGGTFWNPDEPGGWGYGNAPKSEEEFLARYSGLTAVLMQNPRVCGFCYTQLTDIEQEQNGLYKYDRSRKFSDKIYEAIREVNTQTAAIEK